MVISAAEPKTSSLRRRDFHPAANDALFATSSSIAEFHGVNTHENL